MTAVPLLDSHKGCHCRKPVSPVASFFRRAIAAVRRRLPVPAARPAGTGTVLLAPPDGQPVLRDRMLSEVRAEWTCRSVRERRDCYVIVDDRNHVSLHMPDGDPRDLHRRKPMAGRQPWQTAAMPVYGQAPAARVLEAERLAGVMQR